MPAICLDQEHIVHNIGTTERLRLIPHGFIRNSEDQFPLYRVVLESRRVFWWTEVQRLRRCVAMRSQETREGFIERVMSLSGLKQTGTMTKLDPSEYNLGTLLGWRKKMIDEQRAVIFPFLKYHHKSGHFVTLELITEHFRCMPPYELCALSHQCTKAEFEEVRCG